MALETAELEQLITPIDKMVVRYLQRNKQGATIMDIVHQIQCEMGPMREDNGNLGQAVSSVLENAIELGFIEKKKPDETRPFSVLVHEGCPEFRMSRGRSRRRSRSRARRRRRRCIRRRRLRPRCI